MHERSVFLWNQPASSAERRFAVAVIVVSTVIFLIVAPFAQVQLPRLPGFIPVYAVALILNDLVTAIFLLGQLHISRSNSILWLACGYLFTAFMALVHALSFPDLFSASGLFGAGPQTTAWLFMFWHAGFPLAVIAYAVSSGRRGDLQPAAILPSIATVPIVVFAFAVLATLGHDLLPAIMQGDHYTPAMIAVVSTTWGLSVAAVVVLWRRRSDSVLDLWLIVVMCAWVFDIALSAVFNAGRYDLGFYAGRIYGLVAASFVLIMLIIQSSKLYIQVIQLREADRLKADELQRLSTIDALTGIGNRRAFDEALDQEWRRTMRHNTGLCLVLIDVDYFKRFNDSYGHPAGDQCLRAVAQVLAARARRAGELAARYGGEEFAVLLPHTTIEDAHRMAEHLCEAVRALRIPHAASDVADHVTISVGVASASRFLPRAAAAPEDARAAPALRPEPASLVKVADQALYQAKTGGRDRVVSARIDSSGHATVEQVGQAA